MNKICFLVIIIISLLFGSCRLKDKEKSSTKVNYIGKGEILNEVRMKTGSLKASKLSQNVRINDIVISQSTIEEVLGSFGNPDSVIGMKNYCGSGQGEEKVIYYGNSKFRCWDGKVQSFCISDEIYEFEQALSVGDDVSKIRDIYPETFTKEVIKHRKFQVNYDKTFWIAAVGDGDGVYILSLNGKIVHFYYIVEC